MRIKTIILITLIYLSTSAISWEKFELFRIQSLTTSGNYDYQQIFNDHTLKIDPSKVIHTNTNVENMTSVAVVDASKIGSQVGILSDFINQVPALSIAKTADPLTYDLPGQEIAYTYLVTNTGDVPLLNITVDDDKTATTCPDTSGGMLPMEEITCSSNYIITQDDLNAGFVTNTAWATDGLIQSDPVSATITAVQAPELSLTKTADPLTYTLPGQVISYSYLVTNTGNLSLLGPVIMSDDKATDEVCPALSLVGNGDEFLDPGESLVCNATYTITVDDMNSGSVTNIAEASAGGTTSPTDTATVTATPVLAIVKTATPTTYNQVGQVIAYTFQVSNPGYFSLAGQVTVSDDKATNESCPSVNSVGNHDRNLDPGEVLTCSASYTITQADINAGSVTNIATASASGITSPPATATVTAIQAPALTLIKTADPLTYYQVGQVIAYTYQVSNSGNVSLLGPVTVSDDKAIDEACPPVSSVGNVDNSLDPAESLTCSASYTITQADLNAGSVTNIASAYAGGTTSPTDSVTITSNSQPALSISKNAAPLEYDHLGQVISYTYLVSNSGNLGLLGPVTVSDDKATDEACPPLSSVGNGDDTLDPAESLTCSASYIITQADLDAGSVTNIASASAGGTDSPTDSATVTAVQNPSLTIAKSADPQTYEQAGQVIGYTYLVTNTGNVTIDAPFTIYDNKTNNESCPATPSSLSPGQSITCSSSYMIQPVDLPYGTVTNVAHATGMFNKITILSNTDTETVSAINIVRLTFLPSVYMSQPGVHLLPNPYSYVSRNTQFIIGEVSNNTNSTLTWVDIVVDFFDASDVKIGSSHSYLWPLDLPAWKKGCFKISSDITSWSYYVLYNPTYSTVATSPGLAILNANGTYDPVSGDYEFTGQVRNNGSQLSMNVGVSGTLYNLAGVPVGCDYNYVSGKDLNPGQTSSYTINFLGYFRDYFDVTSYKLRVSGELP
jgi:uncharacterized repeat protein (TIGR01451 family)